MTTWTTLRRHALARLSQQAELLGANAVIGVVAEREQEVARRAEAEALGWTDFGNDDFEEIMSTHYGRMVVLDDRVIMFANPEDAAEYIDFDLKEVVR